MATLVQTNRTWVVSAVYPKKRETILEKLLPRRCMVVSAGLIAAGLGLVALVLLGALPLSFWLFLAAFLLSGTGAVLALIFYGEI